MKKTLIMVLFVLLCPVWAVPGQQSGKISVQGGEHTQPPQPFTNESIAGLVKIGFSDATIISMIQHQPGSYSLRVDDVTALKNAGVSEGVIAAMSSKMGIGPTPAPVAPAAAAPPRETELKREPGQGAKEKDQPAQPLTNGSIVKLVKAGLSEDTVIKMVDTQPGKYSLGVEDIIALKNAGVSEKVITAMLNRSATAPTPVGAPSGVPAKQSHPLQASPMPSVEADTASKGGAAQPFGFDKGMTRDQIIGIVGKGAVDPKLSEGDVLVLNTAPKPHPDFATYILFIAPAEGLLKIKAMRKPIQTGDTGSELRSAFDEVVEGVTQKYGTSTRTLDFCNGGTGCSGDDVWMLGLLQKNRTLSTWWDFAHNPVNPASTSFHGITNVLVEAVALDLNTGYVLFTCEFEGWEAYVDAKKAKQSNVY